jgi:hypothetical protein
VAAYTMNIANYQLWPVVSAARCLKLISCNGSLLIVFRNVIDFNFKIVDTREKYIGIINLIFILLQSLIKLLFLTKSFDNPPKFDKRLTLVPSSTLLLIAHLLHDLRL